MRLISTRYLIVGKYDWYQWGIKLHMGRLLFHLGKFTVGIG